MIFNFKTLHDKPFKYNGFIINENDVDEKKEHEALIASGDIDNYFEILQGFIKQEANENVKWKETLLQDLTNLKYIKGFVQTLGEYCSEIKEINYYKHKNKGKYDLIIQFHERFHAIHHLTPDPVDGSIWKDFDKTDSFYLELLAQLFIWVYINDYRNDLRDLFLELNQNQSYIYKTWKLFYHYKFNEKDAWDLYWKIRNKEDLGFLEIIYKNYIKYMKETDKLLSNDEKIVEDAVFEGIHTTITRFREYPFLYFTEPDIHSSLKADIVKNNSKLFYKTIKAEKRLQISLVHLEYPTNFLFSRKAFKEINLEESKHLKQRGHFDLVILNPCFIDAVSERDNKVELLKGIIAKDYKLYKELHNDNELSSGKELLYIIEVKFTHFQTSKSILDEIKIDNFKLSEALKDNNHIRPIILIFCYAEDKSKIDLLKRKDIYNPNILNIFIETSINKTGVKQRVKPSYLYDTIDNMMPTWVTKIVKGYTKKIL